MAVGDGTVGHGAPERRQRDSLRVGRPVRVLGEGCRAGGHGIVEAGARHQLVNQIPFQRPAPAHAFARGTEVIGAVAAHAAFVHDAGEPAGTRQDREQRYFRQRHGGGPVIDQEDVVGRERKLVAAARSGARDHGHPALARVGRCILDGVAGLVGELAEVDLIDVRRAGEHRNVRAGTEHAVLRRGEHHGARARVLETQALNNVVELDIDAEIVGVELQRIVAGNGAILVHVERERGNGTVDGEAPVAVLVRVGPEVDHRPRHPSGSGAAPRCRWCARDYMACPGPLSTEIGPQAGGHTLEHFRFTRKRSRHLSLTAAGLRPAPPRGRRRSGGPRSRPVACPTMSDTL